MKTKGVCILPGGHPLSTRTYVDLAAVLPERKLPHFLEEFVHMVSLQTISG